MELKVDTSKTYAIALEGGGARGAYQVGAWKALSEAGIKYNDKETLYILLHDFNGNTTIVDGLPEIIRRLKQKGYEFKIMDESTPPMAF